MKRGKEIKMSLSDNYNVVSGTVDNKNPKALYINVSAWGEPTQEEELDYGKIIRNLNKQVRKSLYNNLDESHFLRDKSIVDLDMRESGVMFGKRSFMSCEVTLYQTEERPINTDDMVEELKTITNSMIEGVFDSHDYFAFHKTKT